MKLLAYITLILSFLCFIPESFAQENTQKTQKLVYTELVTQADIPYFLGQRE